MLFIDLVMRMDIFMLFGLGCGLIIIEMGNICGVDRYKQVKEKYGSELSKLVVG